MNANNNSNFMINNKPFINDDDVMGKWVTMFMGELNLTIMFLKDVISKYCNT